MPRFRIEALGTHHARRSFSCDVPALDRYLHELASQDVKRRISNCFVACSEADAIAGFYTFAAASLPLDELTPEESKRLPRYPVLPAGLIGRLAVDMHFRGLHLGSAMIIDAVTRATQSHPAVFALIVDAKDETALAFYEHLGFRRFHSKPMRLFLPVATALQALAD